MHMQILGACFYSQGCAVYQSKLLKMKTHSCCYAEQLLWYIISTRVGSLNSVL